MGIPTYSVQPSLPLLCSRYMRLAPLQFLLSLLVAPPPFSFLPLPPSSSLFLVLPTPLHSVPPLCLFPSHCLP